MTTGPAARAANIGPRGCRRRIAMGAAALLVGVVVLAALLATGADRGWRAALFLPFWAGALGIFQARGRT